MSGSSTDYNRFRASRWRLVALLLFVNTSVLGLAWMSLDSSYRQYQDRAAVSSRNTNRLVSQSIAGDIDQIDLALRAVSDEVTRLHASKAIAGPELTVFLARLQNRLKMADGLRVTDAAGIVIASGDKAGLGTNLSDRAYFTVHRDDANSGMVISPPTLGRISNKWVLIFARRLSLPDGGFAGIVFAPVTIAWFEQKFNNLEVGPQGTVVMRGDASRNFDLLARYPHAGYVGQTTVSRTFTERITANPKGGTYEASAGADNIRRTFSYQPIADYPLITLVGMATEDYLGEWRKESVKVIVLAGAFIIVTTLGGFGMLRSWRTLERQTDELARSNADLEQFAYVASHDLQTPLRNIASYAQLLARRYQGRLDKDADEFIGYIVGGAKHMSSMIPDLLDYARVSRSPPELVPVDLNAVMTSVLTNLGPDLQASGATVKMDALPVVLAEARQVESLFQNLLENALIYRQPDAAPQIEITATQEPKGLWRVSVHDNGIGIEPAYFEKIFVIFQRLEPARFPGGTGIGLALCRRIVHRFGGTIWVESEPKKGTTINFTLRPSTGGSAAG
ncbi:Phytochrome two-component sensor histidine kinase Cyanobacterial phytochrome B [Paramagnetospirillum magnetotacticum MS-1]|uniref:histidine kinase n=1 Tax=Paramagnetospirillum magnetotacticum MS-1 TaxID=272627 RepID=A0A0C2YW98_PARME|nr:ATP-binding protein [Paramagnetospirillum magnetotacticum]KIL99393.1 Phytochrome two-component sensor histidine kinase Cyanobacterial phytochrome B [Paramagnetospirillum magnetotacticum MS-1]